MSERVKRLRLPVRELARIIGCDKMTAHRALDGGHDARISTLRKLDAALGAEERALFDWLVALHPHWLDAAGDGRRAA